MPRISVIIPTRDRLRPLAACLQALAASFPDDAETIVVSDGGGVPLEPHVAPFVEPLRLRCITVPHRGPAAARNRGLAIAAGEIVVFTDDDCRPRPGWVSAIASGVSLSPPRAAGGTTLNGLLSNPYADAAQVILDIIDRHDVARHGSPRFFPSNNIAFPAHALRAIGGFDESFRTAEDRELCRRWSQAGFGMDRVGAAILNHDPNLNFQRFLRLFFTYGRGAAQFHASGKKGGFRETAALHLSFPTLARKEIVRRGFWRGSRLATLLLLWEIANTAGFLSSTPDTVPSSPIPSDLGRRTP